MKQQKAAIYDMDGLLLDTENLWGVSMLKIAEKHGVNIRSDFFKYTTGLRINEVTSFWQEKFGWSSNVNSEGMANEIVEDIIQLTKEKGGVMPGIISSLEQFKSNGYKLAVATSSPQRMMDELLAHFGLIHYFDYLASAEQESHGKPHPAVYLTAAEKLNLSPWHCVAFEDSMNGMIAAKAARMKVVGVPEHHNSNNPKFAIADILYNSMEQMDIDEIERILN